jgi:D-3-phosphoglycerate dehydrogenase
MAGVNSKRVFYTSPVPPVGFVDKLGQRPDITVDYLLQATPDHDADRILSVAHVYQIGSARDELLPKLHAHADLLKRTPSLLVVSTGGAGYDTVNVKHCTDAGVLVVNQTGGNKQAVAEHVVALMLMLSKRIMETDRNLRRGTLGDRAKFMGNDVFGKTVGIIGLGNVGGTLAKLCNTLLQMTVLAYDPYLTAEQIKERGAEKVELDDLLRRSDFVSTNCPLTDETRNLVGAREYALMKPTAFYINAARGFIHDEAALADVLRSKRIAGAGLDVWAKEPPGAEHPLMAFDNVIVSPHTAGVTVEARAKMGQFAADQVLDLLDGRYPPRPVNPEVWPVYAKRFEKTFGFAPQR